MEETVQLAEKVKLHSIVIRHLHLSFSVFIECKQLHYFRDNEHVETESKPIKTI